MRLRRSSIETPGITRRRRGTGFSYEDAAGGPVRDEETLERIRTLAIPPAWDDVWICPDAAGHIQATGTDAAGRRQYLYHADWRVRRDAEKFDRMLAFAARRHASASAGSPERSARSAIDWISRTTSAITMGRGPPSVPAIDLSSQSEVLELVGLRSHERVLPFVHPTPRSAIS